MDLTKEQAVEALTTWKNSEDPDDQAALAEHQSSHANGSDTGTWLLGGSNLKSEFECIFCELEAEAGLRQPA